MGSVSFLALLICLAAVPLASVRQTLARLLITLTLFAAHLAATLVYFTYFYTRAADSWFYYFNPTRYGIGRDGLGTVFVVNVSRFLRSTLGASFLDTFILFQSFGFLGLVILMRTFQEVQIKLGARESLLPLLLLFVPSAHFWTVALGKDAPLFFAVSLCVWAMLNPRGRILFLLLSLGVMILFRAHIALIAVSAMALAAVFHASIPLGRKAALIGAGLVGIVLLAGPVQSTIQVDVSSVDSMSSFLDRTSSLSSNSAGSTSVLNASLPVKIVSLLFRPFFFDAGGPMGLVASVENVGVLLAFYYLFNGRRELRMLAKNVYFVRFILVFAAVLLFFLALVYYNVGLGLRQRVMAYPMIFSMLATLHYLRLRMPGSETPPVAPARGFSMRPPPSQALSHDIQR